MGQKINPTGLRIGVIKNWESRWYANPNKFGDTLVEDYNLREYLLEKLAPAGYPRLRSNATLSVFTSTFTALSPAWSSAARALR